MKEHKNFQKTNSAFALLEVLASIVLIGVLLSNMSNMWTYTNKLSNTISDISTEEKKLEEELKNRYVYFEEYKFIDAK